MTKSSFLYQQVIGVTENYFGPAADRFVDRQIHNHLKINPEQLREQDLLRLIKWITLAMALLVEDESLIKKYAAELKALTGKKRLSKTMKKESLPST
jgi:hypothetical protein